MIRDPNVVFAWAQGVAVGLGFGGLLALLVSWCVRAWWALVEDARDGAL